MATRTWLIFLVLTFNVFMLCTFAKLMLKKYDNCDPTVVYALAYSNVVITTVGDKQYLDLAFNITAPLDNSIRFNATVEMLVGKRYQYLLSINERKACEAINKYYGEFWYDLERYAQMIPGKCPKPQGRYHVHNAPLNFDKVVTLGVFPFGNLRITENFYNKDNSVFSCIVIEVEHHQ